MVALELNLIVSGCPPRLHCLRPIEPFPIQKRLAGTVKLSSRRLGGAWRVRDPSRMTTLRSPVYAGYRYPAELISYAVCRIFDFR